MWRWFEEAVSLGEFSVTCGVPQGSILGLVRFSLHPLPLGSTFGELIIIFSFIYIAPNHNYSWIEAVFNVRSSVPQKEPNSLQLLLDFLGSKLNKHAIKTCAWLQPVCWHSTQTPPSNTGCGVPAYREVSICCYISISLLLPCLF